MFKLIHSKTITNTFLLVRCYHTKRIRVRFAPSPTGYLHLGGLRTALYNFLFAKSHNGKLLLRIEDTDQTRTVEGAREQLQKDLNWAGIYLDEGPTIGGAYGPYVQSQRLDIYKEEVKTLLNNESAYYCFCSNKRLDLLRLEALRARQIPKYDNRCRNLTLSEIKSKMERMEPYCIRFKLIPGSVTFEDSIYGTITYDVSLNEGDPVIVKSDGFPTYHYANVVDDHFMEISHVFRGVEWQISTTKHLMMYRAFNWDPPIYGHLPLLLNADGSKLSKRQGDIQISSYKKIGILPQALVNFITHSGGGFEKDALRHLQPKCYSMAELAEQFDITKINSHSGKLMPERLLEFNRLEIERQLKNSEDLKVLITKVQDIIKEKFPSRVLDNSLNLDEDYIKSVLVWAVNRLNTLSDLVSNQLAFLWVHSEDSLKSNREEVLVIEKFKKCLKTQEDLTKDGLKKSLKHFASENDIKFSNLMHTLRSILSGLEEGPSVAEMIEILGRDNTLLRLESYIKKNRD